MILWWFFFIWFRCPEHFVSRTYVISSMRPRWLYGIISQINHKKMDIPDIYASHSDSWHAIYIPQASLIYALLFDVPLHDYSGYCDGKKDRPRHTLIIGLLFIFFWGIFHCLPSRYSNLFIHYIRLYFLNCLFLLWELILSKSFTSYLHLIPVMELWFLALSFLRIIPW